MATGEYKLCFGGGDLGTGATGAAMPILGIPDIADISAVPIPQKGRLKSIVLVGKPASGDTVTVQMTAGGTATGPTAVATNALPTQALNFGPNDAVPEVDLTAIGMQYTTTTTGTYGVRDVYAELSFELLDD